MWEDSQRWPAGRTGGVFKPGPECRWAAFGQLTPFPILPNLRLRYVARVAKRRVAPRSAICASRPTATASSVSIFGARAVSRVGVDGLLDQLLSDCGIALGRRRISNKPKCCNRECENVSQDCPLNDPLCSDDHRKQNDDAGSSQDETPAWMMGAGINHVHPASHRCHIRSGVGARASMLLPAGASRPPRPAVHLPIGLESERMRGPPAASQEIAFV